MSKGFASRLATAEKPKWLPSTAPSLVSVTSAVVEAPVPDAVELMVEGGERVDEGETTDRHGHARVLPRPRTVAPMPPSGPASISVGPARGCRPSSCADRSRTRLDVGVRERWRGACGVRCCELGDGSDGAPTGRVRGRTRAEGREAERCRHGDRPCSAGPTARYHDDSDGSAAPSRRPAGTSACGAWGRDAYPGAPLPGSDYPGLLSAGLWEVEADQDWGLDWHVNEGVEVTFVTRGRVRFASSHQEHDLQRGWVTVTRPWQRHRLGAPHVTACTLGWFVVDVGRAPPKPGVELARLAAPHRAGPPAADGAAPRVRRAPSWPASVELMDAFERLERAMRWSVRPHRAADRARRHRGPAESSRTCSSVAPRT